MHVALDLHIGGPHVEAVRDAGSPVWAASLGVAAAPIVSLKGLLSLTGA